MLFLAGYVSAEKAKLVAFDPGGNLTSDNKAMAAFTAATGIEVEMMTGSWTEWDDKVPIMLATGQQLDLIRLDQGHSVKAVREDWLLPLNAFIKKNNINLNDWPQSILWYTPFDRTGELYALPNYMATTVMFYNRQVYADSGVAFPSAKYGDVSTKWNNWFDSLKKLMSVDSSGVVKRWGTSLQVSGLRMLASFDLDWVNTDVTYFRGADPDVMSAYTSISNLWVVDGVAKYNTGSVYKGSVANQVVQTGSWMFSLDPKAYDLGVAPPPWAVPTGHVQSGISSWGITKSTKYPDAAWEFVKYFTHGDGIVAWMDNVNMGPILLRRYRQQWIDRVQSHMPNADLNVILNAGEYYWNSRWSSSPAYTECNQMLTEAMDAIANGTKSVYIAMNEIKNPINSLLKQNPTFGK